MQRLGFRVLMLWLLVMSCFSFTQVVFPLDSITAANSTTVAIIAPAKVTAGQTFAVSIEVNPGVPVAGLQFDFSYTASAVIPANQTSPVTEGTWLSQGGANTTYFLGGTANTGTINGVIGVITSAGKSVSTAGTFATISFIAKENGGPCAFSLSNVIIGDGSGQSVPVVVVNGQTNVNRAPIIASIGNKSVNEGSELRFTLSASDADGDQLTYSALNLPAGALFNISTKTFSWTPNYAQSGTYDNITFRVTDGLATTQLMITITVSQPFTDWDLNEDGKVNTLDMIRIGQVWGSTGVVGWVKEDTNHDGVINVLDMILVGQHWS